MTLFILALLTVPRFWRWRRTRNREVRAGQSRQPVAELLAQHAGADFFNFTLIELTQLKRAKRDADEPRDSEPQIPEYIADLAVFAFTDTEREPHIRALHAIKRGVDRTVVHAVDDDAVAEPLEPVLADRATRAHAIAPQPSRFR